MDRNRPFRFGVVSKGAASREAWLAQARRAEELGYSTFSIDDHVDHRLAPIAAIFAAALATTTLRVGCCVFANDFRHPVMLAKEAASLDLLTSGRIELGFGVGYLRSDYDLLGVPLEPPGVRVDRFSEAVQIMKGLFGDGPMTFAGRYYAVKGLDLQPKPVQRPHPPLLIGGGGRRVLQIAAREADIVGINGKSSTWGAIDWDSLSPEATAKKVTWVKEAAGARFEQLELHMLIIYLEITDEPRRAAAAMIREWGIEDKITVDQVLLTPHILIGTEEQIVETLKVRRARYGTSYIAVAKQAMEKFAPIARRLVDQ